MDAVGDSAVAPERIQSTCAELLSHIFQRLNVKEREVAPAVDAQWIRQHARLTVPKHSLSIRLNRLGLVAHLQRQLVQAFEDEIHTLHAVSSSALSKVCHGGAPLMPEGQENAKRLVTFAQKMFERRVRATENKVVALCTRQSPPDRGKKSHPADEDSALIVIKSEDISDEEAPGLEADPKQYHNALEYIFRRGIEKPSKSDKMAFAAKTGLSYRTVTVWFQNRRSRGALGGRCGWREKQRMRSLGITDEQILLLDDANGLEPISSSSAEEPFGSESEAVNEIGESDHYDTTRADTMSDLSETEAEFDESEWETDLEDIPDTTSPTGGIRRVPSLTRSVSTSSSASNYVESRGCSPGPEYARRSFSPVSIPPPAFNHRAARQLRSPSPAPSVHSKSPLLDDDAKLPPLDTPQLNAPFRLGSWRTNHSGGSLSQTLVTMRTPRPQEHTPSFSLSPPPVLDSEDQVLEAPSPAESEGGIVTPPTVTSFKFSSSPAQPIDTQTQTPKQFTFGSSYASGSKSPVSQFTFDLARKPSSLPNSRTGPFTPRPQQASITPSVTPKELSAPFVFGQQQYANPCTPSAPQFTFGHSTSSSLSSSTSSATSVKFGTGHSAGFPPSKSSFSESFLNPAASGASNVRSSSSGMNNYCAPYSVGRQPSPTIFAPQFSIPSPGAFDFSNPRPPSPKSDQSAKIVAVPAVFTFGMQPQSPSTQQAAQPTRPHNERLDAARQKEVPTAFTFLNVDEPPTPFVFGSTIPKNTPSTEPASIHSMLPASSQPLPLSAASSSPAAVHTVSPPLPTSSSVTIPPPPTPSLHEQAASSFKAQLNISQPTAPLAAKSKASLVSTPRKPSTLPKHTAAAWSPSRAPPSRPVPSPSNPKGKGKMPMCDFFAVPSTSRSKDNVTQLDILADAALGTTTLDEDTAISLPLPTSPSPRGAPFPLLDEYEDSDADSDGGDADDEDEPLMGNALPPMQATAPTTNTVSPPTSAFNFSFPAPASLSTPNLAYTEVMRKRLVYFTRNYRTSGLRPAVHLTDRR